VPIFHKKNAVISEKMRFYKEKNADLPENADFQEKIQTFQKKCRFPRKNVNFIFQS